MAPSDPELLVFLHVPKAAGTTLHTILDRNYERDAIYTVDGSHGDAVDASLAALRALPDAEKRRLRVVKGHMAFGIHEAMPQSSAYVTVLRDPVGRVVSHYRYVLRHPEHYLHEQVAGTGMSLGDYVASGLSVELENGQTQLLAGLWNERIPITREHLAQATHALEEHVSVAGLADRFDESLLLMRRAHGWRLPLYVSENVAPRGDAKPLDPGVRAEIERRNELDLELVATVRDRLDAQIAAVGPAFGRELRRFRRLNRAYAGTARATRAPRAAVRRLRAAG